MKKCFAARIAPTSTDTALLLIRVVAGLGLILHGWGKFQAPFAWMGPESPVPGIFQFLAAFSEVGGGLALIIGLLSRLGALGIVFTMLGAVATHMVMLGDPFVNTTGQGGSYELASLYLMISFFIVLSGPGKFSLDAKIFGTKV